MPNDPIVEALRIWRLTAITGDLTRVELMETVFKAGYEAAREGDGWSNTPPIQFQYTNWRGETEIRRAIPKGFRYGTSEFHKHPTHLMIAFDVDKQADREFDVVCMSKIGSLAPAPPAVTKGS